MAEEPDHSAAQTGLEQPSPQDQAVARVPNSNTAAELRSISADPHRKRKKAERLTDYEEVSGEAPGAPTTKRSRRVAGVDSSGDNHNEEVDTRDAVIADLQAKLRGRDREIASLKEHEKVSQFLLDQWLPDDADSMTEVEFVFGRCIRNYPFPRAEAEHKIRTMAHAEQPKEVRDVSRRRYWTFWPPQTPGVQRFGDMPSTVCETVLKLYIRMLENNLSDATLLCSELISRLPSSEFHQAAAAYKTIYDLALAEEVMKFAPAPNLLLNLRELGHLVHEKFGSSSEQLTGCTHPFLHSSSVVNMFCRFVSESRTEDSSQLPGTLAKMCFDKRGSPSPPAFYREEIPNRGWLLNRMEDRFLLIDFNTHRVRIVERGGCTLERSSADPSKAHLRLRGIWGAEEMVLTLPMELGYWLGDWAKIKVDALRPAVDCTQGQGSRPSH